MEAMSVLIKLAMNMHSRCSRSAVMNDAARAVTELPDLVMRARAEFREMPGMCLTAAQAARLWCLSPAHAEQLLNELVQMGFLVRRDARYGRPSSV